MPNITICKNPFRPQLDRVETSARAGTRLDTVLRREHLIRGRGRSLVRNHTFVVQVNGNWLTQDKWAYRLKSEDVVFVALLPAGGGGSNPLQMVAMIALAVAAVYTGGLAAAAYGTATGVAAGATTIGMSVAGAIASTAVMVAGGMLLSAIFPPAKPPSTMAREQSSPTYTIGAQGNTARLMESIPVQYGRFRVYPDFAAQPYTETDSNNVFLYQLFCLGQGELDIEKIRIEDTPIENFAEVTWEVVRPGEKVTLFPDNVVTSSAVQGIELKAANEEGGGGYVGPFVSNPAGTTCNAIGIDMAVPAGLFNAHRDGLRTSWVQWHIEIRPIDDSGAAVGDWRLLTDGYWQDNTATPQTRSYRHDVPDGRYEVRAIRVNPKILSEQNQNTVVWSGLRAYLPSKESYGDITLLAVVARATNSLNQSTARRINVIATRKLRTWDPMNGWSYTMKATRNPAWALADACKNSVYGRGLPDSRINLPGLYRLAQIWEARGDTYDGVFDTATTLWDALTRIARVGRAMPMYYAGVIDFIRNEPKTVKTQMFTPGNMVTNSFSIDYVFPEHDSPDHVVVEFINEETWQPDEVVCTLPGSAQMRPYRLQIPGIVQREQAWREGISLAAQNRDQRRFVSFQTELEGNIPRYGDLVEISHDVPKWGLTGFIEGYDPDTKTLVTSEPLEWWRGENHYINLRKRDGSPDGPYRVVEGSHEREAVIADGVDGYAIFVSDGQGEEFTYYQFGPGERRSLLAQAVSAVPDEQGNVTLDFVNYADSVHAAEYGGAVPPPNPPSLLPMTPNAPIVNEVSVYATPVSGEQIAACTPARGAQGYEFQASDDLGASWAPLGSDTAPSIRIRLPAGPWWVRARGVGAMPGPWKVWQGYISATMLPPAALVDLAAKPLNFGIRLEWVWPSAIALRYIEIWHSQTPEFLDAAPLGQFSYPQSSHEMAGLAAGRIFYFWARIRDEADQPGPWFPESGAGVLGQSSADADDILELLEGQIGENQLTGELLRPIQLVDQINDVMIPGLADDLARNAQALAQEKQDRATALAAEAQARLDGDVAAAQALAAGLLSEAQERGAAISQEKTERQQADSSLAGQIDTVTAAVGANAAAISQEAQARASGDSAEANQRQMLAAQLRGGHEGSDLDGVTSGLIAQEKAARTTQYEGLARQMTLLSAGVGEQFDHAKIWYFTGSTEGWSTATLVEGSWLRPNDSPGYTRSPRGLGINGAEFQQLRVRVRKVGAPTWDCIVGVYAPGATSYVAIKPAEPAWDENGIGMLVLSHEHTGTIDGLLLRGGTGRTATNYFAFDWVAVGRPAPGASSSALSDEATARATADSAEATKRETLSVKLTGKADPAGAALGNLTSGLIFDERQARVSGDEAVMTEVTGLKARMPAGGGKLATEASVTAEAQARASADSALASRSEALEARMPTGAGKVATAASVSTLENRVETVEGKTQANSSALTTVQSGLSTLSGAAGVGQNLLIHSDVELIRTTSTYLFGRYHLTEDFIPGQEYTLVTCVTHHKDPSDTLNSAVRVWAGGASNYVGEVARDVDRRIRVLRFTKNDRNDAPRELRFYYAPGPGTQPGEAIVHWAALYKGSVTPPLELPPRVEGLEVATEANAVATQELNTRVEQTEQNIMSAGQSITKIDARLTAKQDSDSLLPDYMMANPESWYSYYPNTDISSNFVQVADGRVAPTAFRFGAGRTYNFSVVTLPITRRYRVQAWMRRSADSDGHMRFTYKYRKTTDADSGAQTNYSSRTVTDQVPADGKWHLAEFVYVVPASLLNDGFTGIRFGFAINDTGTKGWAEIQGYCVTKVMQGADINPAEVATAQSVSSLSGVVSEQGRIITSQGQAHTNLQNRVNDPKTGLAAQSAALSDLKSWTQLADGKFTAQANSINGLSAEVGNALASVALVQNALAETNGKLSATTTLKTEVHSGGKSYVAGISAGVVVEPGKPVQSEVLFLADRFGFLSLVNGVISTPFVIQNGQVFISQAFIGQSWIKSANIQSIDANKIESRNLAAKMASIGTAYVNRANIEHAAVDTLRIAGNAVAIHAGASADARTLNISESDLNVTITLPHMADVTISASVQGAGWGYWNLLEHQLRVNWISYGSIADVNNSGGAMVLKTRVAPGTHTFTLRQKSFGTGATASDYMYGQAGLSVICTMR